MEGNTVVESTGSELKIILKYFNMSDKVNCFGNDFPSCNILLDSRNLGDLNFPLNMKVKFQISKNLLNLNEFIVNYLIFMFLI